MAEKQVRAAAPAAGAAGRGPPPADDSWSAKLPGILKSVAMFMLMQMAMKYGMSYLGMGGQAPQSPAPAKPVAPGSTSNPAPASAGGQTPRVLAEPMWDLGTPVSMLLYLSTSETSADVDYDKPLIAWDDLTYGNWKDEREVDLLLDVPDSVRTGNGSWWMDIRLVKGGGTSMLGKSIDEVASYRKQLVRYITKRKVRKEKKLIGGKEDDLQDEPEEEDTTGPTIVGHWASNLTLTIVSSGGKVDVGQIPPITAPHFLIVPGPVPGQSYYYPPVFPNDFWLLKENLWPINETSHKLPLHLNYHAISSMKFNIFASMTASMDQAAAQQGAGAEFDEIKRTLTETSPWLLITTAVVTVLHMLFEFLAFSSDVSHWRKKDKDKDLVGVSLNTILTNCVVQLVILLYLHDSSEETSFMILFGQGIGLLIEAWKITKVVNVRIRQDPKSLIGYKITFENKRELSEDEKKTQEYDRLAFRLVSYGAMPLLAGYTIYSLMYETHRGWYSFIVSTLAQAIYMFGFVQLVPQLIINYKLKSVAHIPMKAMMYKTLSTVVDDFFAFCVRMPWLHRLACFRDDVVFLILLYQRWIYRVDYSRVNEYGQVAEGKVEPVGDEAKAKEESKKDR